MLKGETQDSENILTEIVTCFNTRIGLKKRYFYFEVLICHNRELLTSLHNIQHLQFLAKEVFLLH